MRYVLVAMTLLLIIRVEAQSWELLQYDSLKSGLEINPLKGFSTIFNPDPTNNFPSSVQGKLFGLDAIMLGPTSFDWQVVDDFLDEMSGQGKHAYLQVNIDPAYGATHLPAYLFPLVDTFYYDDPKPIDPVDDLCPDWNDPDLMDAMLTFIDSFGMRYDSDPRIFTVHLGLYGMWGEWHIGDVELVKPEYAMTEENKTLIANAYADAFPNTLLLARYPENMPEPQDYGYSDGFFFSQSIGDDNPFHFHTTIKANNADLNWQRIPIGGEIDPALQSTLWDNWPNTVGQNVSECFDSIRPSWLISHHHFTDQIVEGTDEWDNSIRAQREMGYTLYVDSVRVTATDGRPSVEVNIRNKGLAPFYASWDVELAALDANNIMTSLGSVDWNLNQIQPSVGINYRSFTSGSQLTDGTYRFLLRVVNPLESYATDVLPPFTFANTTQDVDLAGWLTLGTATLAGGGLGTSPIHTTDISLSHSIDTITAAESLQLVATVLPTNATNTNVTWTSSRPRTVQIDGTGLATPGQEYGTSVISAYTLDGGHVAQCTVTYKPIFVNLPALVEAEDFIDMDGVQQGSCCEGTTFLEYIDNNDWMDYGVVASEPSVFQIDFRVSSDNTAGEIAIINENNDTLTIRSIDTGSWWEDYQIRISDPFLLPAGEQVLRLAAATGGFNIDYLDFKLLPSTYTFLGTVDDQYDVGANWDTGTPPPDRYPGTIHIAADCEVPATTILTLGTGGNLIINTNITMSVK